jgi:hypothetical protein
MSKKFRQITGLILLAVFSLSLVNIADSIFENNAIEVIKIEKVKHNFSYVPTKEEVKKTEKKRKTAHIPAVEKNFVGFKEALAYKESRGKYSLVNTLGYMGKYQFGKTTLKGLKINPKNFLKDPLLQEKAFVAYLERNKWILRKEIKTFDGKWVGGIKITESGILAAAHLGGAGAVQKYLWSQGKNTMSDAYGTTIKHYLKRFSGYDLSNIKAKKKIKVIR